MVVNRVNKCSAACLLIFFEHFPKDGLSNRFFYSSKKSGRYSDVKVHAAKVIHNMAQLHSGLEHLIF